MKILVLNYEYPPVGGGGGRVCARIAEGLSARGHEVRVVTAGVGELPLHAEEHGVLVLRPRTGRRKRDTCSVPEMALYLAAALPCALRQCAGWKPDVIHAHFLVPTGALAWLVHLPTRIPYVLTAHLGDVPGGVPEQTAGLFRWVSPAASAIWRGAARCTAVSAHVAGLAEKAFGRPALVIPNGIPAVPPPARLVPNSVPRVLVAGRLSVQKNPILAVETMAKLRDLAWTMEFLGDGPLEREVREAVAAAGLDSRACFRGWVDTEGVKEAMRGADILLMTSRSEGLPMAAIEALWHGLAIVATKIPGMAEVVGDANGACAGPDAASLAQALRPLLAGREALTSARRASLELAPRFEIGRSVRAYEEVFAAVANHSVR